MPLYCPTISLVLTVQPVSLLWLRPLDSWMSSVPFRPGVSRPPSPSFRPSGSFLMLCALHLSSPYTMPIWVVLVELQLWSSVTAPGIGAMPLLILEYFSRGFFDLMFCVAFFISGPLTQPNSGPPYMLPVLPALFLCILALCPSFVWFRCMFHFWGHVSLCLHSLCLLIRELRSCK